MAQKFRSLAIFMLKYGAALLIFGGAYLYSQIETARQRDAAEAVMAAASDKEKAVLGLIGSLDYVLVILNAKGAVIEWNPATEKLTGYTKAEMLGGSITPIIPPEMRAMHHTAFAAAFQDDKKLGKIQIVNCQIVRKDPNKKPVSVRVAVRVVKFGAEKFAIANIDRESKITELDVGGESP